MIQFTTATIMRPQPDFENLYEGVDARTLLLFYPYGKAADELAGENGYDQRLANGRDVVLGSRVIVYIPKIEAVINPGPVYWRYNWTFIWRMRSTNDYLLGRKPFHLPKVGQGVVDAGGVPPGARAVIPAADHTVVYDQPEPTSDFLGVAQHDRLETITPVNFDPLITAEGVAYRTPLFSAGQPAVIQQGLADQAALGRTFAYKPLYRAVKLEAFGDELLVGVWRQPLATDDNTTSANWDFGAAATLFTNVDALISSLFGKSGTGGSASQPDLGVYVISGD